MKDSGRRCRIIASANLPIAFSLFGRFPQLITFSQYFFTFPLFLGLFEQLISQSIHQMPLAKYSKIDVQVWHTTRILLSDTPTSSDRRGGWEPRFYIYIKQFISRYLLHLRTLDKDCLSTISLEMKGRLRLRKKLEETLKSILSSQSARRSVVPEKERVGTSWRTCEARAACAQGTSQARVEWK